jgi:hypothetical protein
MSIRFHAMYPLFLSYFNGTFNLLDRFSKNIRIPNFMKIRPVRAQLFHAEEQTDGWTDMTTLTVAFRNFANTPQYELFPVTGGSTETTNGCGRVSYVFKRADRHV